MGEHFNPVMLDDFLTVLNGIFDFRAPHLMLILGRFEEVVDNVVIKADSDGGGTDQDMLSFYNNPSTNYRDKTYYNDDDDDDEDYLDDAEYFTNK